MIRGTPIPVELLLRKPSDLLEAYPHLTREDIHAAMRYAADRGGLLSSHKEHVALTAHNPPG